MTLRLPFWCYAFRKPLSCHLQQARTPSLLSSLMLSLLLSAPASFADSVTPTHNDDTNDTPVADDELVVYGHQEPATDTSYRLYDQQALAAGYQNLGEFLSRINGLQVQSLGGLGDPVLISMQGADAKQTRLLIDGVDVTTGQYGQYDLNAIPLASIERVDVLTSGSDADDNGLISDEAIGGTINIVTRRSPSNTSSRPTQLSAAAGSYGTATLNLQQPLRTQPHSTTDLLIDHQQSDNNYRYPVSSPEDTSQPAGQQQALNNAAYRRDRLTLKHQQPGLFASLYWQDESKQLPQYYRNSSSNRSRLDSKQLGVQLSGNWGQDFRQHWQLWHSLNRQAFYDPTAVFGYVDSNNRYRYQHSEAKLGSQVQWHAWDLGSSIKISQQSYRSRYLIDSDSGDCDSLSSRCDQYSWLRQVQLSGRAQWQNSDSTRQFSLSSSHHQQNSLLQTSATDSSDSDNTHQQQSWTSGLVSLKQYWLSDTGNGQLQLSWKQALRIPSLYERFGNRGLTRGNDDLQPEQSQTLSLNISWSGDWQQRPQQLSLNLFHRQLENAIVAVYDPSTGAGRYENTSDATMAGLEWQLHSQLNRPVTAAPAAESLGMWQLQLAGSHYQSQSSSDIVGFDNKYLPGIYHLRLIAGLLWQSSMTTRHHCIDLHAELADDLYLDRYNSVPGDQRRLWNIHYRYQWPVPSRPSLLPTHAGLRINNLFNHSFNDFSGRPARGREWTLYLSYSL
jgi:outer membrane cobalamin receptor